MKLLSRSNVLEEMSKTRSDYELNLNLPPSTRGRAVAALCAVCR